MKLVLLCIALAVLPAVCVPATAHHRKHAYRTAETLLKDCQSDAPVMRSMCLGYLAAISDAVESDQDAGTLPRKVCDPATISLEDYRLALIGFLRDRPQLLGRSSSEVVSAAYAQAWPCKTD
jgi:hypothetical protein